jgi:hypothetical protein
VTLLVGTADRSAGTGLREQYLPRGDVLHAELCGQSLALRSLAAARGGDHQQPHFASQPKPSSRGAEHSSIVTVMKPVVYVPWYQVRPWILCGGDLPLS